MARVNLQVGRGFCPSCDGPVVCERNPLGWGRGDLVLAACTLGLWLLPRLLFDALANPWRCSRCGGGTE